MKYEDLTTDQLLEALPHHLHVAHNDNAEPHDRWRIYNMASQKYLEPGTHDVRQLLVSTLKHIDLLQDKTVTNKPSTKLVCGSIAEGKGDLESAIKLRQIEEQGFFGGVLVCLQVLHQYDAHTQATDIVEAVGGITIATEYANKSGSEVDLDTIKWIKSGKVC